MQSHPQVVILVELLRPSFLIDRSVVHLELQRQTDQASGIVLGFLIDDPFFRISIFSSTPSFPGSSTITDAPPSPPTRKHRPLHGDDMPRAFSARVRKGVHSELVFARGEVWRKSAPST